MTSAPTATALAASVSPALASAARPPTRSLLARRHCLPLPHRRRVPGPRRRPTQNHPDPRKSTTAGSTEPPPALPLLQAGLCSPGTGLRRGVRSEATYSWWTLRALMTWARTVVVPGLCREPQGVEGRPPPQGPTRSCRSCSPPRGPSVKDARTSVPVRTCLPSSQTGSTGGAAIPSRNGLASGLNSTCARSSAARTTIRSKFW